MRAHAVVHLSVRSLYLQQLVPNQDITPTKVSTYDIRSDTLTKHVKRDVLERLRSGSCLFNGACSGDVVFA